MSKECETCIKYKTMLCPNSSECYCLKDKPLYETFKGNETALNLKSELLKETKKELRGYRRELNSLGNPKGKVKGKNKMSEEGFKISMPIITNQEELRIDNFFHEILDEILEKQIKLREDAIAQRLLMNVYKENKQLQQERENLIKYLEDTIEELECDDVDDEEMRGYLIQRRSDFKEILEKVCGKYE